ncbi:50S ribosomal protein L21 [Candidatus Azambacteria bacterium]|nr:50S ribosomal protein L21 [Candidatus Azambacteria bacterium]MBI3685668.1 50S ribosomal protein L21 [Candidatus Azambacteria bacterium]
MFSVIETGGKQYKVSVGGKVKIEKLEGREGDAVVFDKVLLWASSEKEAKIGEPYLKNTKVTGEIVKQGVGDKVIVFKYKPKKRHRKKKGHRQLFTEVRITKIEG